MDDCWKSGPLFLSLSLSSLRCCRAFVLLVREERAHEREEQINLSNSMYFWDSILFFFDDYQLDFSWDQRELNIEIRKEKTMEICTRIENLQFAGLFLLSRFFFFSSFFSVNS